MSEDIRAQWISALASGKTFADVGGLWGTIAEQVTVAARAGATATTMIDITPEDDGVGGLWSLFRERAASFGVTPVCVQGSIDDPSLPARVGAFDVVHCGGVLYHCPHPMYTLQQLRNVTRETLILATATVPETVTTPAGTLNLATGSALFVPALTTSQRVILGDWLGAVTAQALGVNMPMNGGWALDDYAPWWWFFTPDYVAKLLEVSGFEVRQAAAFWAGRATVYEARVL